MQNHLAAAANQGTGSCCGVRRLKDKVHSEGPAWTVNLYQYLEEQEGKVGDVLVGRVKS